MTVIAPRITWELDGQVAVDVIEAGAQIEEVQATAAQLGEHVGADDVDLVLIAVPATEGHRVAAAVSWALGLVGTSEDQA